MNDANLKRTLGLILRNKKILFALLERFEASDMERGIAAIHQDILNKDVKMFVMDQYSDYLNDYHIVFDNNAIFLHLNLQLKQLGSIKAKYMLQIQKFQFDSQAHMVTLTYKEDVKSEGNFIQNMAVKAAGLKGNYIESAIEMAKLNFIQTDKESIRINLDLLDFIKKIPPALNLRFISSENEILKLHFNI